MIWEYIVVGIVIIGAIYFAGRDFIRTARGEQSPCGTCSERGSCKLNKPDPDSKECREKGKGRSP